MEGFQSSTEVRDLQWVSEDDVQILNDSKKSVARWKPDGNNTILA